MSAATITAFATIAAALFAFIGSTVSIYLTKKKEREAAWRAKKNGLL
jgi:cbb3-type cytochrome oxidase subunit 3